MRMTVVALLVLLMAGGGIVSASTTPASSGVRLDGLRYGGLPQEIELPGGLVIVKAVSFARLTVNGAAPVPVQAVAFLYPNEDTIHFLIAVNYETARTRARMFLIARDSSGLRFRQETSLRLSEGVQITLFFLQASIENAAEQFRMGARVRWESLLTTPIFSPTSVFGSEFVALFEKLGASRAPLPSFGLDTRSASLLLWYVCEAPPRKVWYNIIRILPFAPR